MAKVTAELLSRYHHDITNSDDRFIAGIPKIELHVHLEGTLAPALRWKLAQKNTD